MKGVIIAPAFHHYNDEIAESFEKRGYNITLCEYYDGFSLSISRLFRNILKHGYSFFSPSTRKLREEKYDFILVVKGDSLCHNLLSSLSSKTERLFLWFYDPIDKFPKVKETFKYYSAIFLFQYSDFKANRSKSKFHYLPLYHRFSNVDRGINIDKPIDFLFVGAITQNRIQILQKLVEVFYDKKIVVYGGYGLFKLLRYKKILRQYPNLRGILHFGLVSPQKLRMLYLSSKFGLNIFQEGQTGLNMRFFEMYGAGVRQVLWCDGCDVKYIKADESAYRIVQKLDDLNHIKCWIEDMKDYEEHDDAMSLKSRIDYILSVG